MEKLTLELPSMYGDHHVIEVRRILLDLPGVVDVYASSAFRTVEVSYDSSKVQPQAIYDRLEAEVYIGDVAAPVEKPAAPHQREASDSYFRHTAMYEHIRQVVGFGQNVSYTGRPLWPCPGMGPIRVKELEEE